MDWEAGRQEAMMQQEGRQSSRQPDGLGGRQAGRQEGRQSGRQADGLVGRQADRTYKFVQLLHLLHLRQVMCLHNIMHKIV